MVSASDGMLSQAVTRILALFVTKMSPNVKKTNTKQNLLYTRFQPSLMLNLWVSHCILAQRLSGLMAIVTYHPYAMHISIVIIDWPNISRCKGHITFTMK